MSAGYQCIANELPRQIEFIHKNIPASFNWIDLTQSILPFKSEESNTLKDPSVLISSISNQIKIFVNIALGREEQLNDPERNIDSIFYGDQKVNMGLTATLLFRIIQMLEPKEEILQAMLNIFALKEEDSFDKQFPEEFKKLPPHHKAAEALRLIELVSCRNHPQNSMDVINNHLKLAGFKIPTPKAPNNN